MRIVLIVPVSGEAMRKALNTSKLVKKQVTVKRGGRSFQSYRWVKPNEAPGPEREQRDPEDVRGSQHGYGMHRINNGDTVSFKADGSTMRGTVVDDTHNEGVVVEAEGGRKFNVKWRDITWFEGAKKPGEAKGGDAKPVVTEQKQAEMVDPDSFTASVWGKQYDDPDATADSIIDEVEQEHPGVREEIAKTEKRLKTLEQTISFYRTEGEGAAAVYTPERWAKHEKILRGIFSAEKLAAATPSDGERPVFIMLGGRGGSGKSWFKGKVYDESRSIVLDADEIKGQLDEYEGWNAAQVHEESSDILEKALATARALGLNVVLDATMKTTKSALKKVEYFKERGYSIEAHYMYCPRQVAAKRAVGRFMGKTKRYVPVDVVLSNTSNEATFDEVRKYADAWSFRNNAGETGGNPVLVSEQGRRRFSELLKALLYDRLVKGLYSRRRERIKPMKERKDAARFDEYDNGPVTPDDKLAPDVKKLIESLKPAPDKARRANGPAKP